MDLVKAKDPLQVTLALYPFGRETRKGIGKGVMLMRYSLLDVIWSDAPEYTIQVKESNLLSKEELKLYTTFLGSKVPAKLVELKVLSGGPELEV